MNSGIVRALASAALFGASTPFAKLLLGDVSPLLLAALLYLGSGIGLAAWIRKLPRQVDSSEVEFFFDSILARKRAGGRLPSASWGRSSL